MTAEPTDRGPQPTVLDPVESGVGAPPTSLDGGGGRPPVVPPTAFDDPDGDDRDPDRDRETFLNLPQRLQPDYEVIRELAQGGEGDLLLTRHLPTDEERVVKIYRGQRRRDERAHELLRSADHAHVVVIHEWGESGGRFWEVMEYCRYGSLADLAGREGPALSRERIVAVIEEVMQALVCVHERKIPHRDLKPANILIRTREPRLDLVLADFGLARVIDLSREMHSRLVLSAAYAAPQTIAGAISPAMDWWSLGIIVAELALGRNPFQRQDGEFLANALIMNEISSRSVDLSGIEDEGLRDLCRGLTRRDDRAGHRWGATEVGEWLEGKDVAVAPEENVAPAPRKAASPFPFRDPMTGHAKTFTDPVELAAALAQDWEGACALLDGSAARRAEQRALRNFLRSLDLTEGEAILAEQDDVEERLVRLLVALDPLVVPTFRGFAVDREGLLLLAEADDEGPRAALTKLMSERILLSYARGADHGDLADLDAAWHEELAEFERTIDTTKGEDGKPILNNEGEREIAVEGARRSILAALLDAESRRAVLARAAAAARDESARRQTWFTDLARMSEAFDG
jgi:serine/threonine protein kinase